MPALEKPKHGKARGTIGLSVHANKEEVAIVSMNTAGNDSPYEHRAKVVCTYRRNCLSFNEYCR